MVFFTANKMIFVVNPDYIAILNTHFTSIASAEELNLNNAYSICAKQYCLTSKNTNNRGKNFIIF